MGRHQRMVQMEDSICVFLSWYKIIEEKYMKKLIEILMDIRNDIHRIRQVQDAQWRLTVLHADPEDMEKVEEMSLQEWGKTLNN